jgi:hypothetical protein
MSKALHVKIVKLDVFQKDCINLATKLYFFLLFKGAQSVLSLNEVDLKRSLLDPAVYDKTVRPRINASHTVKVDVGFTNVFVIELVSILF